MEQFSVSTINPDITELSSIMYRLDDLPKGHMALCTHSTDPKIASLPTSVTAKKNDTYRTGREDSIHDVHFADMCINSSNTVLSRLPVALKPYPEILSMLAGRDYATSIRLNDLSKDRQITFSYAGFMRDEKGTLHTVTRFEEGVTSCDNLVFNPERTPEEVYLALTTAAESLLFLHGEAGMTHGDFLPRNTAYDPSLQFRIIDTTTAKESINPNDYIDDIQRYIAGLHDTNVHEELSIPNEAINEIFLDTYQKTAKDTLPTEIRNIILGKVSRLMIDLDKA